MASRLSRWHENWTFTEQLLPYTVPFLVFSKVSCCGSHMFKCTCKWHCYNFPVRYYKLVALPCLLPYLQMYLKYNRVLYVCKRTTPKWYVVLMFSWQIKIVPVTLSLWLKCNIRCSHFSSLVIATCAMGESKISVIQRVVLITAKNVIPFVTTWWGK